MGNRGTIPGGFVITQKLTGFFSSRIVCNTYGIIKGKFSQNFIEGLIGIRVPFAYATIHQ
jgi:hypothetical protein